MKQFYTALLLCVCVVTAPAAGAASLWHHVSGGNASRSRLASSATYAVYTLEEATLRSQLLGLSTDPSKGTVIELPLPDGTTAYFRVWASSLLPARLAAKYPQLKTFTAEDITDRKITAKLDFTAFGFHAVIFCAGNTSFIDPSDNSNSGYYTAHYKKDEIRKYEERTQCLVPQQATATAEQLSESKRKMAARTTNGYDLRTYRLALSCDHQYAQAATGITNPTIAQVLSKMVTSMNRINGVYERELSITMNLVENEDTLIWTSDAGGINGTDPFSDNDANACLSANQTVCDARIGTASYDLGHVFTTGAGGLSQVGVVCNASLKAQSVTGQPNPVGDGFDIDYVAHEMGHEFGADHPFNNGLDGSCANGNINAPTAYEPGSGSTIMAYAGICAPDDLQPHSDAYFHAISLEQIQNYITTFGDGCAVKAASGNKPVGLPAFTAFYFIPYLTPFELTAPPAADSVADTANTYNWEEMDLGDVGMELIHTHDAGPIFRSFYPVTSLTRIFPANSMVLAGSLSNAGTEGAEGEKAADVARYLTFGLTVRDIYQGNGCFLIPDDIIQLNAVNTGGGFKVTSQATAGLICVSGSTQTVTWDVVHTDVSPISAASVDIYLSVDGGNTWPILIGNFPNTGTASITVPATDSTITAARIKVKGSGNVFFNVNGADFKVIQDIEIKVYPVPANNVLHITTGTNSDVQVVIDNVIGQQVWKGLITSDLALPVSLWARGIYFLRTTDIQNHHTVKKFVLN